MSETYIAAGEKSPSFQVSADTSALVKIMENAQINQLFTYIELTQAIGREVKGGSACAKSAIEILRREKRIVFVTVRGIGYKRLSDESIVDLSDSALAHSRRHASRTMKKIFCSDYSKLSKEGQIKHNVAASTFGVLKEITSRAGQERLTHRVAETGTSIPVDMAAIEAIGKIA